MDKSQEQYEPLNIKVERELKTKLRVAAKKEHRSLQGQVLFFMEEGLRHLSAASGSKSPKQKGKAA